MAEFPIKFVLTLEDQLSAAIGSVKSSLAGLGADFDRVDASVTASQDAMGQFASEAQTGSSEVKQATQDMGSAFESAKGQVDEINDSYGYLSQSTEKVSGATQKTSASFTDQVSAANTLALSGVTLYLSFERVEKAQLASDKANLLVTKSMERVDQATKSVAKAIAEYGEGSVQAVDAQDKLNIATEQLSLAQERQGIVSKDLNNTYMTTALSVIPAVVGIFTSLGSIMETTGLAQTFSAISQQAANQAYIMGVPAATGLSGAMQTLNTVLMENPIILVVAALVAIGAALYAAYTYCEPFRNAVDAVGKAIGDFLKPIIDGLVAGLTWLWKNIFEPFVAFLSFGAMVALQKLGEAFKWLADGLKPLIDAFKWLVDTVGGAIDSIGNSTEDYKILLAAMTESTKNGLSVQENYYSDKFAAMTKTVDDALAKQVAEINSRYAEMTDAENKAYEADIANLNAYWDKKLGATTTELEKIDAKINEYYDKQIAAVTKSTDDMIAYLQAGYDKELSDFSAFYEAKYGTATTELSKAQDLITSHYDDEIAKVKISYDDQISAINSFYDGMLSATNAGLDSLRAAHQQANDDQELLMLEEKVSIEQAHAAGLIDEETYKKQLSDLSKSYNEERGIAQDAFRLEELRLERQAKVDGVTIEEERASELKKVKEQETIDITGIENTKNTELTDAATKYNQITTADFQALTEAIKGLKQTENTEVNRINNEKNALLKEAADKYNAMEKDHADALLKISTDRAKDIKDAVTTSAAEKRDLLAQLEDEINANTSLKEGEKLAIIQAINDQIIYGCQETARLVRAASDAMYDAAIDAGISVATATAAVNGLQQAAAAANMTPGTGSNVTVSAAQQAIYDQQNQFLAALNAGQITADQYATAMAYTRQQLAGLAEGGTARENMWAVVGEAGPELLHLNRGDSVIPLETQPTLAQVGQGGNRYITQEFNIRPFIHIGNVSQAIDLKKVREVILDEMNNALGEASSEAMY